MSEDLEKRGLSADCKLDPALVMACYMVGEHPCDRCNCDRAECRGFPRKDSEPQQEATDGQ